nr:hypothetical protein [Tanacetum cinerariifolium]
MDFSKLKLIKGYEGLENEDIYPTQEVFTHRGDGGCRQSFEAPYPLLPLLVLADSHPLVELVVLYMIYHSCVVCCVVGLEFALRNRVLLWKSLKTRVLRWTVLIDSSLVGLTVLIEIIALKTILVVTLLSRLMKSRWTCLIRNILTILNNITDCYGDANFRDCFKRCSRSDDRILHFVERFFKSIHAYIELIFKCCSSAEDQKSLIEKKKKVEHLCLL